MKALPIKAGVVVDEWKLPIFTQHLDAAGFTYERVGKPAPAVVLLRVECPRDQVERLKAVMADAMRVAASLRDMPGKAN